MYNIDKITISEEQQKEYIRLYQETHDSKYLSYIIKNNVGFIWNCSKKYNIKNNGKIHIDDIISAGYCGLTKAVEKFDLKYNNKFLTYAENWIAQYMKCEFKRMCRTVRIPKDEYVKNPEKYKNEVEIDQFEMKDFIEGILSKNAFNSVNNYTKIDFEKIISIMHDVLSVREIDCICRHFGVNDYNKHTFDEIGMIYNLSRSRTQQIVRCAIYKLNHFLNSKKKRNYAYEKKMHIRSKFKGSNKS